jgi:hypothetical protein
MKQLRESADYIEEQQGRIDTRTHDLLLGMSFIDQKVERVLAIVGNSADTNPNEVCLCIYRYISFGL